MSLRFLLLSFLPLVAAGATYTTSTFSDLQARINSAIPGDTIIVANGTYSADATLSIKCVGTAAARITIAAETVGGVEIRGPRGISFSSPAAYVTLQGFKLTHSGSISISSGTHFVRITRNVIELSIPSGSDVSYLNISGDDVEIDRNELRNKSTLGEMLDIAGSGNQVARRLWVHHNYFHDFRSPGGNGAETIRWGLSGLSLSNGQGLCEYNLFVRCDGENEMISNKSSGNTYRYNTVVDCPGGEISQRHGDNCLYYGNYLRNTQGIRVYGDNHLIFSNYLEGNSVGINMGNGDGDVHAGDALTSHDRPDNNIVVFNTLINNTTQYEMTGRTGGLGATNTTFANNLIVGGNTAVSISGSAPYTNPTWTGNLIWGVANIGNIPSSGYAVADPLLAADASGVYHLRTGSPAIDSAVGSYPDVTIDLDGQPRTDPKDKGADEFSTSAIGARLLTTADVGPASSDFVAPPVISRQPESHTMALGDPVVFRVTASGQDLTYQWTFNGVPLAGRTALFCRIEATAANAGKYACVVSNAGGSVTSADAELTLLATSDPGRLTNLSIRANAGRDEKTLTVGAVSTAGTGGGGLPVLIRAGGPSLAQFEIPTYLRDPQLSVLDHAKAVVASNDNWDGDPQVTRIGARFAAYNFISPLDAAMYLPSLPASDYTMQVTSVDGTEGIALVELYEANPAYDPSASRLVNVSARTEVGLDDNVLVAGFGISGSTSKTVLLRGIGPRLADFEVPGAIADPKLDLFAGQQLLESNDDWGGDPTLASAFTSVAAFDLKSDSKDAALLVTLRPGSYTLQLSGVGRTTGIGMVEVYEAK